MLQTGPDAVTKKRLESFLAAHDYQPAPVTFDNSDWMFSYVLQDQAMAERPVISFFEKRSVEVVGREFPQVLLIHANELNAGAVGYVGAARVPVRFAGPWVAGCGLPTAEWVCGEEWFFLDSPMVDDPGDSPEE